MKYLYWLALLPFSILLGLFGRLLSPIVCLFIVREPRLDTVKRLGKQKVLMNRDRLVSWLSWFDTFDNATDEYWYGMYGFDEGFTQQDYDECAVCRWMYRILWLQRNSMYGFTRKYLSIKPTSPLAWTFKGNVPIGFGLQMHINVGWKAHKNYTDLMYAGRPLGRISKK